MTPAPREADALVAPVVVLADAPQGVRSHSSTVNVRFCERRTLMKPAETCREEDKQSDQGLCARARGDTPSDRDRTWQAGPQGQREGHDPRCESSRRYSVHQSTAKTDLSDLWKLLRTSSEGMGGNHKTGGAKPQQRLEMNGVQIKCMQICGALLCVDRV